MNLKNVSQLCALLLALAPALSLGQGAPWKTEGTRADEIKALAAKLQSPDTPQMEKVIACHRLAVVGTRDAIPALAALLADEKLAHMARHALEPMPDPAVDTALREALGRLTGSLQVGVIDSIGFRRDAKATDALAALLASSDPAVAGAAAGALGRIGTVDAAKKLQAALARATGPAQLTLADACLNCAEMLVTGRKAKDAIAIYDRLCEKSYPHFIRTAAMCGAIAARRDDGIPLLIAQLKGEDAATLAAGWRAARELPGAAVTKALAAALPRLPVAKQVLLLQVFSDRADKAALPATLDVAKGSVAELRVLALRILPRIDDGRSSLPVLLATIKANTEPTETEAAIASLSAIGGTDTNAKILAALPTVSPAMRARLIVVLGVRRAESARGEIFKLAAGSDQEIAKASFRALGQLARPADLPELIRLSTAATEEGVKVQADLAVYAVSMKILPAEQRVDPVLAAYQAAKSAPAKCSLMRPLGAIVKANGGSEKAFAAMKAAYADADAQVSETALRTLADWPDASPAAMMLEVVQQTKSAVHREVAFQGGVRMAANVADGRDTTKLDFVAWFTAANQAVRSREEKLAIVSGLGSIKRVDGLNLLLPYLDDPAVQTEAALAVIEVAPALAKTPHAAKVKGVLQKIVASTKDADVRRNANKVLATLSGKAPAAKKKA